MVYKIAVGVTKKVDKIPRSKKLTWEREDNRMLFVPVGKKLPLWV